MAQLKQIIAAYCCDTDILLAVSSGIYQITTKSRLQLCIQCDICNMTQLQKKYGTY